MDVLGFSMGGYTAQELALIQPTAVRRLVLAATAPRGAPGIHGLRDDVLAHVNLDQLGAQNYLYTFFNHTASSQRSGLELLGRSMEREHDRDLPVSADAREAQYEAILEWGVPDQDALRRLDAIEQPALVAGGDYDLVIPPPHSSCSGTRCPTPACACTRTPDTASCSSTTKSSRGRSWTSCAEGTGHPCGDAKTPHRRDAARPRTSIYVCGNLTKLPSTCLMTCGVSTCHSICVPP